MQESWSKQPANKIKKMQQQAHKYTDNNISTVNPEALCLHLLLCFEPAC